MPLSWVIERPHPSFAYLRRLAPLRICCRTAQLASRTRKSTHFYLSSIFVILPARLKIGLLRIIHLEPSRQSLINKLYSPYPSPSLLPSSSVLPLPAPIYTILSSSFSPPKSLISFNPGLPVVSFAPANLRPSLSKFDYPQNNPGSTVWKFPSPQLPSYPIPHLQQHPRSSPFVGFVVPSGTAAVWAALGLVICRPFISIAAVQSGLRGIGAAVERLGDDFLFLSGVVVGLLFRRSYLSTVPLSA